MKKSELRELIREEIEKLNEAIFKEGYYILKQLNQNTERIFPDAADIGVPSKKGDKWWNMVKQLIDMYGVKGSRKKTGNTISHTIELVDEGAVSDERKTLKQATEQFKVNYVTCTTGKCKGKDGYFNVYSIK